MEPLSIIFDESSDSSMLDQIEVFWGKYQQNKKI
jgi:hypothetical protein